MSPTELLAFGNFLLDFANECVWRDDEPLALTMKAFAVLAYLVQHPDRVVTKAELFTAAWPGVVVSDWALATCIRELRRVLGDSAKTPRMIETVHRRGYRFLSTMTAATGSRSKFHVPGGQAAEQLTHNESPETALRTRNQEREILLVGRDTELAQLHDLLGKALTGERQMIFVTGEPGIGKTSVVTAFVAQLADDHALGIGYGQCINHYGAGEAYLPLLSALGQLCRASDGQPLVTLLTQHAPTWLVQLPALLTDEELTALQRKTTGATKERILRELAEALEVLTAERPVMLVLEDLHWSDPSTLDFVAMVARRRELARLLVIGTYRPSEVFAGEHPLRTVIQELLGHRQCQELNLEGFSEGAVEVYVEQRFPLHVFPARFAHLLHQRTGGNPLFLVNLIDDWVAQGTLSNGEGGWMVHGDVETLVQQVPDSSRQLLAAQMARLSPITQQTLAAASVAGTVFSAAAVAAALETPVSTIETCCEDVAQQQVFVQRAGIETWPDGTTAARYGFRHALYQELWHEQGTINQRQEWHQRMGLRKEGAYNGRASEIAAELAVHFEQGRDIHRAVQYLQQAAQNALRRSANMEAIQHLTKGLELLKTLPDNSERMQLELTLQLTLEDALVAVRGYTALEVEKVGTRARDLCRQIGQTPQLFSVLHRAALFYVTRGELQTAREIEEQMLRLAQSVQDQHLLAMAHGVLGATLYWLGELTAARPFLEQAITLYDFQKHPRHTIGTADPRVDFLSCTSWTLWILGYPDQALKGSLEALALARGLSHPFSLAFALGLAASFHILCRERQLAREQAEAMMTLATDQEFPFWLVWGTSVRGWALAEQGQVKEGIAQMQQGLAAFRGMGTEVGRSHWLALLAEAHGEIGQGEQGVVLLAEAFAFVDRTGERWCEAELWRVKGELVLQSGVRSHEASSVQRPKSKVEAEAKECFLRAIAIAQKQEAKSWELRASMSLARLWQQQGKTKEAHEMLSEVYNWFTEGFDTKDLQEAKALLEELTRSS